MEPSPKYPSLDVVRDELDIEESHQVDRGRSADSRAGLVLSAGGVLAGLALSTGSAWSLPGVGLDVAAVLYAALVFKPKIRTSVDPTAFRLKYLAAPREDSQLAALDRRVHDFSANKQSVDAKVRYLGRAITLFVLSTVAIVVGLACAYTLRAAGIWGN